MGGSTTVRRRDVLKSIVTTAAAITSASAASVEAAPGHPRWFQAGDLILFQGDSITDGGRWREGQDYNHIMGQDYAYIIAGEVLSTYPQDNLQFLNRGVSGNTVTDLAARWQTDTLDLKPSLVSILIGVNDTALWSGEKMTTDEGAEAYKAAYDALIQRTLAALPSVKIVLGQPFALPSDENIRAVQAASEQLSVQYHLPYVRYGDMLETLSQQYSWQHWSWDGVHPTYAGHFLMHSLWLETVSQFYVS